jgi:hypothetical protein
MRSNGSSIEELKVVVLADREGWFAQGLEIDYDAQANSLEAVKSNFENGLAGLVSRHLGINGKLDGLLKPTPKDTWKVLWGAGKAYRVSSASFKNRPGLKELPFAGIAYFEQVSWAAEPLERLLNANANQITVLPTS